MNIDKVINEYEKVAMDNTQIMKALDGKTKIVLYTDLDKFKNIDELLHPHDNVVLLFQTTSQTFGHWTCLFKNKNIIYFFDSYALQPDQQIQFSPFLQKATERYILSNMLKTSGYLIKTNKTPYQHVSFKKHTEPNTCGRHCIIRLKMKHLDNEQYNNFMKSSHMDTDKLVSLMTFIL